MVDPQFGPDTRPPAIDFRSVSKSFTVKNNKDTEVLHVVDDMSFVVPDKPDGEFVALLGPSGCGKSTILGMLAGLTKPDKGEVHIFGKKVEDLSPDAVTVPQSYTCFPWLSALGNVEFGLKLNPATRADATEVATTYLQKVGLGDRLHAMPSELSGGMQQRVAIARALAVKPKVLLMDEPFGALDANIRTDMQAMLLSLWAEEKNTVVFITHDITEAILLADRILVLSTKPAHIIQDVNVPFPRPRPSNVAFDPHFIALSQSLLGLLKTTPGTGGQVRVTV
ncbi:MAG: ABC transporter ATP-binding protein [Armatimonadetes bacterium]|nr:ABC transporter ATP-binding protein [Armatimonadota bacterium]